MDESNATNTTLSLLAGGWQSYSEHLGAALAPLTAEQLDLRPAPGLRSIGELARHIIGVRAGWFHDALEVGDADFAGFQAWDGPDAATQPASELVRGLAETWRVVHDAVIRFTPEELAQTITRERRGRVHTLVRGWIVWHVIEHDLHHGGEIAYTLGMHGLQAPDI